MQLEVELIPDHCPDNVRTIHGKSWPQIRELVIAKGYCEICNAKFLKSGKPKKFEAHEVWNFNDVTSTQSLTTIRCTCKLCHLVHHLCHTQKMGSKWFNLAVTHFCKVNQCSIETFKDYFEVKLKEWNERNKKIWHLDITLLSSLFPSITFIKGTTR